jgi:hypothetical protein
VLALLAGLAPDAPAQKHFPDELDNSLAMSMPGFELVSPSHSNLVDYLKFFPILSAAILLLHLSAITRAPIHSPKAFRRRMAHPVVSSRVNLGTSNYRVPSSQGLLTCGMVSITPRQAGNQDRQVA